MTSARWRRPTSTGAPCRAVPLVATSSAAFSAYVDAPVRLFRTERDGDGPDEMPLTVVSSASVEELARRGNHDGPLDPLRFRINLELDGLEPFEEDTWDGGPVRIGGAVVRVAGQIPRCAVTAQDPTTGLHDWNTLKQIAAFRPLTAEREVPFGVYATVEDPGPVAVGDPVTPLGPKSRSPPVPGRPGARMRRSYDGPPILAAFPCSS